jgi:hypothetical protein
MIRVSQTLQFLSLIVIIALSLKWAITGNANFGFGLALMMIAFFGFRNAVRNLKDRQKVVEITIVNKNAKEFNLKGRNALVWHNTRRKISKTSN